jgi:hypothetical protein
MSMLTMRVLNLRKWWRKKWRATLAEAEEAKSLEDITLQKTGRDASGRRFWTQSGSPAQITPLPATISPQEFYHAGNLSSHVRHSSNHSEQFCFNFIHGDRPRDPIHADHPNRRKIKPQESFSTASLIYAQEWGGFW